MILSESTQAKYDMLGFELKVREDTGLIEAVCVHGVGHPIPESVKDLNTTGPWKDRGTWGIHVCDGCCRRFE